MAAVILLNQSADASANAHKKAISRLLNDPSNNGRIERTREEVLAILNAEYPETSVEKPVKQITFVEKIIVIFILGLLFIISSIILTAVINFTVTIYELLQNAKHFEGNYHETKPIGNAMMMMNAARL